MSHKGSKRAVALLVAIAALFMLSLPLAISASADTYDHVTEFLDVLGPMASADMQESGILASLTLAQAIFESNYGRSTLAVEANNLFGIKAYSNWEGMVYCSVNKTLYSSYSEAESILGSAYMTANKERFWRAYESWAGSVADHSDLFNTSDRYENLRGLTDYKLACLYVVQDGYTSDAGYTENLINLIEQFELYNYDVPGAIDPGVVTRVALSDSTVILRVGQSYTLTASVYPTTAVDKTVTWATQDPAVATVSGGLVSAKKTGTVNITATSSNGKSASCTVFVVDDSYTEDISIGVMTYDVYIRASASDSTAGNHGIAKNGTEVKVIGEAIGSFYYIECINDSGQLVRGYVYTSRVKIITPAPGPGEDTDGVALDRTSLSLALGGVDRLVATADGTVSWKSSNESVVTVYGGQIFAFGTGTATVTATYNGFSASCTVTVTDTAKHYTAVITNNVNLRQYLSTSAGSNGIADAGTEVEVIGGAVSGGSDIFYFVICNDLRGGGSGCGYVLESCLGSMEEIAPPPADPVTLDKNSLSLALGGVGKLVATADGAVSWKSSNESVVTVYGGQIFAFGTGTATVTATYNGFSASCTVTVTDTAKHYTAVITNNVNLRQYLSTSAGSNGIADAGTEVEVIGGAVSGGSDIFYFVICNDLRGGGSGCGYVLKECLDFPGGEPQPPEGGFIITDPELSVTEEGYLSGVTAGSTVEELLGGFGNASLAVYDRDGNAITGGTLVGTGSKVCILEGGAVTESIVVVVGGDVNGDGRLNSVDCLIVKRSVVLGGENTLSGAYYEAAKFGADKVSAVSYLLMKRAYLGL